MYPKWLLFVLTLLSCMVLMASAMPVADAPVKRLKQYEMKRRSDGDNLEARGGSHTAWKRTSPSPAHVEAREPSRVWKRTSPSPTPHAK